MQRFTQLRPRVRIPICCLVATWGIACVGPREIQQDSRPGHSEFTHSIDDRATVEPNPRVVRATIDGSLGYLEEEGVGWIDRHGCVSCHQVPAMLWSLNAAARVGAAVDRTKLADWNAWALRTIRTTGADNLDGIYQLLLGRSMPTGGAVRDAFDGLGDIVEGAQEDDGSWAPGGQLPDQRRSLAETRVVSTAWAVLALDALGRRGPTPIDGRAYVSQAFEALAPGESTELWVVRLLVEHRLGEPGRAGALRQALLAAQHDDGGWGWRRGEASDAFATGQALFALRETATPTTAPYERPAVQRAIAFLLASQGADGAWDVPSTVGDGEIHSTSRYWGTGWAIVGLASTLPHSETVAAPTAAG